jgi:hypothetical protein
VPTRTNNYTTTNPQQTSAVVFQTGGDEAFTAGSYWSSTQQASVVTNAFIIALGNGSQTVLAKNNSRLLRAVRRVPV